MNLIVNLNSKIGREKQMDVVFLLFGVKFENNFEHLIVIAGCNVWTFLAFVKIFERHKGFIKFIPLTSWSLHRLTNYLDVFYGFSFVITVQFLENYNSIPILRVSIKRELALLFY